MSTKRTIPRICQQCDKDFLARIDQGSYCSGDCYHQAMREHSPCKNQTSLICPQCSKTFQLKPSHAAGTHYCSKTCYLEGRRSVSWQSRYQSRVDRRGPDECWPYIGTRDKSGYGRLPLNRKNILAHRIAYELAYGPIPDGLFVLHSCDNPCCQNPAHLHIGTHTDNMRERSERGRAPAGATHHSYLHPEWVARGDRSASRLHPESRPRGSLHWKAKLTEADVIAIRKRYIPGRWGGNGRELALEYGVKTDTVRNIVLRRSWAHIP